MALGTEDLDRGEVAVGLSYEIRWSSLVHWARVRLRAHAALTRDSRTKLGTEARRW